MRLLFYIFELCRERLKNTSKKDMRNKNFKLPAVVSMIIYNGKNQWTASRNFKDILCSNELFGENVIDFR
ncbi:MAG: Rpn family recombination-promoting nuclease/putative transposase [Clostridium tyrobutyricum]|jgi:hypothetical protein|nr:Rpn family recombination-promoting nuclease/putative transposase [Clostridium tyrobutyricum]MCH4199408.1 Rpn family recombination-promoting nuclease/putative transposase [Clostridium tyrobutyricum]MCH4237824.1 Rpn family recombination-promoting nuclease/putative transposase [Clostridium tyrobutyricum]MCI1240272.1 Rpn family recombination-promoting nuclease/putative transposase [Clostridium tyrobutyricum]